MAPVVVTGGSGFLALHTIAALLERGHRVRATVRTPVRALLVREVLDRHGVDAGDRLTFAEADLLADDGWAEAVAGCEHVLHLASPFPAVDPEHEDMVVVPARDGTLRVLRAARDAGVRRVVVTSSFAAVGYGRSLPAEHVFTEADWTPPDATGVRAYIRSKAVAERAAWDFVQRDGGGLELCAICPTAILGPVLGPEHSASIGLVEGLLNGSMAAGIPRLSLAVADVRDVAALHLAAMIAPQAAGERFIAAASDGLWLADVARVLRERLAEPIAARLPSVELPDPSAQLLHVSGAKARNVLGWRPRAPEITILETALSLMPEPGAAWSSRPAV
ncbi:SDR family oxidoreductase [Conexibacter woesei]|uniref:SDR family oxidoreductase n=1 Tax=Conexibacter woesei TaxID=191495 RepID=UPI00054EC078|nr:aldehyde reductase [Conexibacter woesei]